MVMAILMTIPNLMIINRVGVTMTITLLSIFMTMFVLGLKLLLARMSGSMNRRQFVPMGASRAMLMLNAFRLMIWLMFTIRIMSMSMIMIMPTLTALTNLFGWP